MMLKKNGFTEKFINILLNVFIAIFSIILLISIYSSVQVKILGSKYSNFFGYSLFEVQTDSMKDVISAGDWIIVKLTKDVKPNDIITYELDREFITHRIIEAYSGTYITRGDNNTGKDPEPVDQSQVVGKLSKVLGGVGILRKTLFNPAVLITLIITLLLFNAAFKKNNHQENIFVTIWDIIKSIIETIAKKKIFNEKREEIIQEMKMTNDDNLKAYSFEEAMNIIEETPRKMGIEDFESFEFPMLDDTTLIKEEIKPDLVSEIEEEPKEIEGIIQVATDLTIISPEKEVMNESTKEIVKEEIDSQNEEIEAPNESEGILAEVKEELPISLEDDLDKTSLYRVIPVDTSDLARTKLELAQHELADEEEVVTKKEEIDEIEQEMQVEDGLTNINLELIKNSKKHKNHIDAIVNIKREELNELVQVFMEDDKLQVNEATIKNEFVNAYLYARYYNYFNELDISYTGKNMVTKLDKMIKLVATNLVEKYSGSDSKYYNKVIIYANIFKVLIKIDYAKDNIKETKLKREYYRDEILRIYKDLEKTRVDSVISEILRVQRSYIDLLKYFFSRLETKDFYLDIVKITGKKDWYAVDLMHNLNFNQVYSDYIIDKTYSEGLVAEDKIQVLFTLLSVQLVQDMINADFENEYVVYIPNSLYKKEKKLTKLLKMIDDEYAKAHVKILLTFDDLKNNKQCIKRVRKLGYRFVMMFNSQTNLLIKDQKELHHMEVIFIDKKDSRFNELMMYIPEELVETIVYDDISKRIEIPEVVSV